MVLLHKQYVVPFYGYCHQGEGTGSRRDVTNEIVYGAVSPSKYPVPEIKSHLVIDLVYVLLAK